MNASVAHSVARVGGSGRGAQRAALVAAILVIVAIAKPWGSSPDLSPAPSLMDSSAIAAPTVKSPNSTTHGPLTVTAPEPSLGPDEIRCLHGFEVVSLVNLGTWNVREWLPVEPVPASGPLDPELTVVALDGGPVRALGACVGQAVGTPPDIELVGAWRLSGRSTPVPRPLRLVELPRSDPANTSAGGLDATGSPPPLAHLYRPATIGPRAPWPNGAYVVKVADPSAPGGIRWLRLAIGPTGASG
jgi:hypothetical protein